MLAAIDTDPPAMLPATPAAVRDKAFVREEVACLLRWSPAVTGTRMREAAELVARLPRTLADLEAGRFSVWHVRSLLEATRPLSAAQTSTVEQRVLPGVGEQTAAEFRRSVARAVARVDTRPVEDRHGEAAANRRVVLCPERDGVASLYAYLPAPDAARIMTRLNHTTDHTVDRTADQGDGVDERSADQRRADTLVDLVCGTGTTSCTGSGTGTRTGKPGGYAEVQLTLSV
jgi:hypothetical protein